MELIIIILQSILIIACCINILYTKWLHRTVLEYKDKYFIADTNKGVK